MSKTFFRLREDHAEVLTVFLLIPLVFFLSAIRSDVVTPDQYSYYHDWFFNPLSFASTVLQSLGMGVLVLFLVGTRSPALAKRWEKGLHSDAGRQIVCGLLMVVISFYYYYVANTLYTMLTNWTTPLRPWEDPVNFPERLQMITVALVNGPAEEVLRAYFVAKIGGWAKNDWVGIVASAAIFSLYHLMYGWFNVAFFFVEGLFLGWLYARKNFFMALVLWHVLSDMQGAISTDGWTQLYALLGLQ